MQRDRAMRMRPLRRETADARLRFADARLQRTTNEVIGFLRAIARLQKPAPLLEWHQPLETLLQTCQFQAGLLQLDTDVRRIARTAHEHFPLAVERQSGYCAVFCRDGNTREVTL